MSLYTDTAALFYNYPASKLVVGIALELTREQFNGFIKEYKENTKEWTFPQDHWESLDELNRIDMKLSNGAALIINVKEL